MRQHLRHLKDKDKLHLSLFSDSSTHSIVIETFDKQDTQPQYPLYTQKHRVTPLQSSRIHPNTTNKILSFERKINQYKQNMMGLIQRSRNQKEKYIKRIIHIVNESRSRLTSRDNKDTHSSTQRSIHSQSVLEHKLTIPKSCKSLRESKTPSIDCSIYTSATNRYSSSQTPKEDRSKLKTIRTCSRGSKYVCVTPATTLTLTPSTTPRETSQRVRMLRKKQQLQEQLRNLNKNLMMRHKAKPRFL